VVSRRPRSFLDHSDSLFLLGRRDVLADVDRLEHGGDLAHLGRRVPTAERRSGHRCPFFPELSAADALPTTAPWSPARLPLKLPVQLGSIPANCSAGVSSFVSAEGAEAARPYSVLQVRPASAAQPSKLCYAREGIDLDVSTLADWVGAAAATLMPLVEATRAHVFAAKRIHADDTTVPVLAKGKTRTGRLRTYERTQVVVATP